MKLRKFIPLLLIIVTLLAAGCAGASADVAAVGQATPQEVYPRLDELDEDTILLDVRTPEEYMEKHIDGAVLHPLQAIEQGDFGGLPKDAEIIVYCRSGNRSAQAANILVQNGYTNVTDLGGIIDWEAAGYPVVVGQ